PVEDFASGTHWNLPRWVRESALRIIRPEMQVNSEGIENIVRTGPDVLDLHPAAVVKYTNLTIPLGSDSTPWGWSVRPASGDLDSTLGTGPFDAALRAAVSRRGLTLDRLRSHLDRRGIPVGLSSL